MDGSPLFSNFTGAVCSYYIHEILRSGAVLGIVLHAKHFHELHCESTGPAQNLCYLLASHSEYLEENDQISS